jgi:hypothetical protein
VIVTLAALGEMILPVVVGNVSKYLGIMLPQSHAYFSTAHGTYSYLQIITSRISRHSALKVGVSLFRVPLQRQIECSKFELM